MWQRQAPSRRRDDPGYGRPKRVHGAKQGGANKSQDIKETLQHKLTKIENGRQSYTGIQLLQRSRGDEVRA
jgi:hypothetical protein